MNNFDLFNTKAEIYNNYRPTYSKKCIKFIYDSKIIARSDIIIDVGAGTGILSKLFLDQGNKVFAIEPNMDMRNKCTENLKQYKNFNSINATAENTMLPPHFANAVIAGQAFHWFDLFAFKKECIRILDDRELVILIWNRKIQNCEMEIERQKIRAQYCSVFDNYSNNWNTREEAIANFFNYNYNCKLFANNLINTYHEFIGRTFSDSRAPFLDSKEYSQYSSALKLYFDKYSIEGKLIVPNETILFWGYL